MNEIKQKIMDEALQHIPFDGWDENVLINACTKLDYDPNYVKIYFPNGVRDLITLFLNDISTKMIAKLDQTDLKSMKVREKIKLSILTKLDLILPHREVVRKITAYSMLPQNLCFSLDKLWCSSSEIWYLVGDNSTDYNYYTKRGLLSTLYGSTILYWLSDESDDYVDTKDFVARRINDIISFASFNWLKDLFKRS
jgi:ubiquinone biosynthesis protein COQ9